jgi:8-oxo-dGTP diphosphatase
MSKYPDSFFRVSVKAVIRDEAGQLLLVKEHFDDWVLPGGGVEEGETMADALKRELKEELGVSNVISSKFISTFSYYAPKKEVWCLWLLYEAEIEGYDMSLASDGSEAAYIDINTFKDSERYSEQRIYKALVG